MKVEQIAVFLENRAGRLAEISEVLAAHAINIQAITVADTADFGILRMIVNDPGRAGSVLREAGFTVGTNEVLVLEIPDRPGGLARVLTILRDADLNVEYMYAYTKKRGDRGLIIFRLDDLQSAREVLTREGIRILAGEEVYTS